ncbi:beta-ketoacyl-ACP synthase [Oricola cellulosilytica]|uniref:Beta-ketoacyl-ACP synthase n=1 Tax=Oricola cellulosilytica TaxID=1429082 RepID=A0A4R0PE09_9HYPH|nr:beta-ketoacyl-ACP synthase [Oricola cellulosilytica]TCD14993.1 beta-ketoacyl-ACP synthase [Oricola cellulosilytica]
MKAPVANDVVITGIGLVSSLGEGADANWKALTNFAGPVLERERFAPYTVHPLPEVDWSQQIAKRDQRQMEAWQRIGTYAAGLALEDAGIKDDEALCASMDMIVAAGGGERDTAVDTMILNRIADGVPDREVLINEVLTTELRPTLFLAQLSNLLAGNISIVHKVTGSSRTFMGEEGAGISALQTTIARIRSGQSTHALVGGAYNAEHPDMLLGYELGHHLHRDAWMPVWQRDRCEGGGVITGSGGVFLVLESRARAERRGVPVYALLGNVAADQGPLDATKTHHRLSQMADEADIGSVDVIISAASGSHARTSAERSFLSDNLTDIPFRGISTATGHLRDAQFPLAVAVAALALRHGSTPAPFDPEIERPAERAPTSVGVIALGYNAGEGMVRVSRAEGDGS